MNLTAISNRARQLLRDTNKTIFTELDITGGINEAIDRVKTIKQLNGMLSLKDGGDIPLLLPEEYHHLLSIYSASRCFFQDEQLQQFTILMNEFESKMFELKNGIESGDIIIKDENGNELDVSTNATDYVRNVYFSPIKTATSETEEEIEAIPEP